MKSVTGAESLCAGLRWVTCPSSLSPQCPSHLGFSSKISVAMMPACLPEADTSTLWNCTRVTVQNAITLSSAINTSLSGTVLLRSILWLAGEKSGVSEQAATVTAMVWCIGNSIPAPQNTTIEEALLTWGSNPTVHKRCVVLITVHRSLLITRVGALHWGQPTTRFTFRQVALHFNCFYSQEAIKERKRGRRKGKVMVQLHACLGWQPLPKRRENPPSNLAFLMHLVCICDI